MFLFLKVQTQKIKMNIAKNQSGEKNQQLRAITILTQEHSQQKTKDAGRLTGPGPTIITTKKKMKHKNLQQRVKLYLNHTETKQSSGLHNISFFFLTQYLSIVANVVGTQSKSPSF